MGVLSHTAQTCIDQNLDLYVKKSVIDIAFGNVLPGDSRQNVANFYAGMIVNGIA
jgi:hypothetical protein